MFSVKCTRLNVIFAVGFVLLAKVCLGMKEVTAEEGKEITLICSGNRTKTIRNIWWTSKNRILSRCFIGNEHCINTDAIQFTAKSSHRERKYTSELTIYNVTAHQRDQVFKCEDDGSENTSTDRSIILRVYHAPESPVCQAQVLSRGRIKIFCETPKVYPDIVCEISQEVYSTSEMTGSSGYDSTAENIANIMYNIYSSKTGAAVYNTAVCSVVICPTQPGLHKFKVKMYPNITNSLVASVDGYTNTVTIRSLGQDCEVAQVQAQSTTEKKDGAIIMNAEPHTGEQSSNYQGHKIEDEVNMKKMTCENDKDTIRRQLIVILLLTILLICNFLFTLLSSIKMRCTGRKRQDQD